MTAPREAAIVAAVERSTVLLRYDDISNASGVLVALCGRYFVLTAAHAAKDPSLRMFLAERSEGVGQNFIELGCRAHQTPDGLARGAWCWSSANEDEADAGVIEVDATFNEQWLKERAVGADGLWPLTAAEFPDRDLPVAISGIPSSQRVHLLGQDRHLGLVVASQHAAELVDQQRQFRLPIWISDAGVDRHSEEVIEVPDFGGMSGGGVWIVDDVCRCFLVGVHQGRAWTHDRERSRRIALATLCSAHVAIVGTLFPEMTDFIHMTWSAVVSVATRSLSPGG